MAGSVSVYGIFDPTTIDAPFYIGVTARAASKRFAEHMGDARSGKAKIPAHDRINAIVGQGLTPAFRVIAVVPADCRDEYERRFIAGYGESLLNRQSGGFVGHTASAATRAKMAERMRGNQNTKGATLTDEHKAKVSAGLTGITRNAETRTKIGAAQAGTPKSAEHRSKIAASLRGKPWSDARRAAHEQRLLKD